MANIIGGLSPVLGYKGNKYRRYKRILAIPKPRGLVGIRGKKGKGRRGKKGKGRRGSVRLSAKRGQ